MKFQWSKGVLIWSVIAGVIMVGLTTFVLHVLDRQIIEQTGAKDLHAEFLRDADSIKRIIGKSGDFYDVSALKEAFDDIIELSPGLRRLSVFELLPDSSGRIHTSDPASAPMRLSDYERIEIAAGRSVAQFDREGSDLGWVFVTPIHVEGEVIGALRGRFSLWEYEWLIRQEGELAKFIGVGAAMLTSLVFFGLIRMQIHRPIQKLMETMRKAESGELSIKAPLTGPADIQEVAQQFNRMLDRIRDALAAKEGLLAEIQCFNQTLVKAVVEAKEELHRAHVLLGEARIQAERASKLAALGELSAVMAHELGNPLNAISGHLQLFQKEMPFQEPNRHLEVIRAEIARMTSIIQHILASTHTEIRLVPVDLNEVIQDVQRLVAPNLSGQHIVIKTELAPALPLVAGDRQALHGVMFNLVLNAIQGMHDRGVLEIVTSPSSRGGVGKAAVFHGSRVKDDAVRVTVRDFGCGIMPEHLPRIFEPFFTTRHHQGGTGLGLAVCQRVIVSLGGRIGVESMVGQGTRFIVDLPRWDDPGRTGDSV